ncbi:MAG TPA: recombinase family protein [Dehalococcoidia bacterium]|nr:recombinase family protein [Dehalococcoidia bacterium]
MIEPQPIQRVAIYARVSTQEQAKGYSIDDQGDRLTDWAHVEGWEVVARFADPGASATSVKHRPQFRRMIDEAEAGTFDAVMVRELSRFARNRGDAAIYRSRLERAGVRLLSYQERTEGLSRPAALMTNGLHELMAEHYSVELSEKTARGWETRAKKGLTLGDVPFGYTRDHAHEPIRPLEPEATAVRYLYESYQTGRHSMAELADELNTQGFQPRSKQGKTRFSKASVERIFKNSTYAGWVTRHGERLRRGFHESLVSDDMFDRVQGSSSRGHGSRGPTGNGQASRTCLAESASARPVSARFGATRPTSESTTTTGAPHGGAGRSARITVSAFAPSRSRRRSAPCSSASISPRIGKSE